MFLTVTWIWLSTSHNSAAVAQRLQSLTPGIVEQRLSSLDLSVKLLSKRRQRDEYFAGQRNSRLCSRWARQLEEIVARIGTASCRLRTGIPHRVSGARHNAGTTETRPHHRGHIRRGGTNH